MRTLLSILFLATTFTSAHAQKKQGQARLDSLLAAVPAMKEDTSGVLLMDEIALAYLGINPVEGLKWGEKELELARGIEWKQGQAYALHMIGANRNMQNDHSGALAAFFQSLRIDEEIGDRVGVGNVSASIGGVYVAIKNYEECLKWQTQALKISLETDNPRLTAYTHSNIGSTYLEMNNLDKAEEHLLRSIALSDSGQYIVALSQGYSNISNVYIKKGMLNTAARYIDRGLRLAEETGNKTFVAICTGNRGVIHMLIAKDSIAPKADSLVPAGRKPNLERAASDLRAGAAACREIGQHSMALLFLKALSETLVLQGEFEEAFHVYQNYRLAKDSVDEAATREKITGLETQRALELKDKDIQIATLEVAKKRNERVFYIAGILLLVIILVILVYNFRRHERSRKRIRALQDHKISELDEAVKRRTHQLGSMRQTIATDFHDHTGNMLAAITRQAATLEVKLLHQPEILPLVRSILANSNDLYASSKDFLWNLNHDSDDPCILFQYLSAYGQRFYNQFDISFSSVVIGEAQVALQLQSLSGLNLIYIFKEAMSNVVKHSGADEVRMELRWETTQVVYSLRDNGIWKKADTSTEHYGLTNMQRRSQQSGFEYNLTHDDGSTCVQVSVPVLAPVSGAVAQSLQ